MFDYSKLNYWKNKENIHQEKAFNNNLQYSH